MVDFILEKTGKSQLHYIGHSQGGLGWTLRCWYRVRAAADLSLCRSPEYQSPRHLHCLCLGHHTASLLATVSTLSSPYQLLLFLVSFFGHDCVAKRSGTVGCAPSPGISNDCYLLAQSCCRGAGGAARKPRGDKEDPVIITAEY